VAHFLDTYIIHTAQFGVNDLPQVSSRRLTDIHSKMANNRMQISFTASLPLILFTSESL